MSDFEDLSIANISMPSTFLENSKLADDASFVLTPNSKISDSSISMNWSGNSLIGTPGGKAFTKPEIRDSSLCNEIQLFRRLSQDEERSRTRYNRALLLVNLMEELFTSGTKLPTDLRIKCSNKLGEFQLHNFLQRNPEQKELLDVDIPLGKVELSVHESDLLRSVMKNLVSAKCSELKTENELISSMLNEPRNRVPLPGSILTAEEGTVLDRLSDLTSLVEQCAANLNSVINIRDELYEVRATKFAELQKAEMENLQSKTKLLGLEFQNLNYAIEDGFVQQFDNMSEAIDVLHRELQVSLHEAEYMLQKQKSRKEKYDSVRGSKFDEILNEYCQLREAYKHKSWALKQIQEKQ